MITKAAITRKRILDKAFQKIYQKGYQSTSIDHILKEMNVTKGAFYYHFKNKKEMGLAVVKEVVYPRLFRLLIEPMENCENPKERLVDVLETAFSEMMDIELTYGCPTNNLIVEMTPVDPDFQKLFRNILDKWKLTLRDAFEKGKEKGYVKDSTNSEYLAQYIIVGYEGLRGLGKVYQNWNYYYQYLAELEEYLKAK